MRRLLLIVILAGAQPPLAARGASPGTIQPGEYVQDREFSTVKIGRPSGGEQRFEIHAADVRLDVCVLEGKMKRGVARVKPEDEEAAKECVVRFTSEGEGIEVSEEENQGDACRSFCTSASVQFTGTFVKAIPACKADQVEAQRKRFKELYDRKAYQEAIELLRPLLDRCGWARLSPTSDGWIRNDLAVAYKRQGDDQACREVLSPLFEEEVWSENPFPAAMSPDLVEQLRPILRATRHNLKLCGAPTSE